MLKYVTKNVINFTMDHKEKRSAASHLLPYKEGVPSTQSHRNEVLSRMFEKLYVRSYLEKMYVQN